MQQNRFQAFSDSEESDQEDVQQQNRPVDTRSRAEKRNKAVKQQTSTNETKANVENNSGKQDGKRVKSQREGQKQKGVSAEPHPQDKHSGSGLRTHDRKGGAGKGNWGTFKDDVKTEQINNEQVEEQTQVQEQQQEEEQQLTLQEYLAQFGGNKTNQTAEQKKGNQDYSAFLKEGCQVIETAQVDDKNPTKKKLVKDSYIGMQNTELLGFRTGLKTIPIKQPRQPREEQQETPKQQEGEQQVTEGQTEQREEKKPYRNNRPHRGGNGNGNRGVNRGGNRQVQKTTVKVNLEDDSLFPKLG